MTYFEVCSKRETFCQSSASVWHKVSSDLKELGFSQSSPSHWHASVQARCSRAHLQFPLHPFLQLQRISSKRGSGAGSLVISVGRS